MFFYWNINRNIIQRVVSSEFDTEVERNSDGVYRKVIKGPLLGRYGLNVIVTLPNMSK